MVTIFTGSATVVSGLARGVADVFTPGCDDLAVAVDDAGAAERDFANAGAAGAPPCRFHAGGWGGFVQATVEHVPSSVGPIEQGETWP